jgi:DNA-3-methyladenine glycosylase
LLGKTTEFFDDVRQAMPNGKRRVTPERCLPSKTAPKPFRSTIARRELPADTVELARWLIGKGLFHNAPEGLAGGRIVETEAYLVGDAASHAFKGLSRRNGAMFLDRGHAYVYFIYGSSYCVNVSSETKGVGAAVLLRALEPTAGKELMAMRRGTSGSRDLARGPGRLAEALGIDLRHDGTDLCNGGSLHLAHIDSALAEIGESRRIGITKEADRVLRFYERGSAFVSGPRRLNL